MPHEGQNAGQAPGRIGVNLGLPFEPRPVGARERRREHHREESSLAQTLLDAAKQVLTVINVPLVQKHRERAAMYGLPLQPLGEILHPGLVYPL